MPTHTSQYGVHESYKLSIIKWFNFLHINCYSIPDYVVSIEFISLYRSELSLQRIDKSLH